MMFITNCKHSSQLTNATRCILHPSYGVTWPAGHDHTISDAVPKILQSPRYILDIVAELGEFKYDCFIRHHVLMTSNTGSSFAW